MTKDIEVKSCKYVYDNINNKYYKRENLTKEINLNSLPRKELEECLWETKDEI